MYFHMCFFFPSPSWGSLGNVPGTDIYKKVTRYKNVRFFNKLSCNKKFCIVAFKSLVEIYNSKGTVRRA